MDTKLLSLFKRYNWFGSHMSILPVGLSLLVSNETSRIKIINSLGRRDAIRRHLSWSCSAQVITAPSHCLHQCWHHQLCSVAVTWEQFRKTKYTDKKISFKCFIGQHINSFPWCRIYASVNWSALVQIMACRLFGTKPLSKPVLGFCQLDP